MYLPAFLLIFLRGLGVVTWQRRFILCGLHYCQVMIPSMLALLWCYDLRCYVNVSWNVGSDKRSYTNTPGPLGHGISNIRFNPYDFYSVCFSVCA